MSLRWIVTIPSLFFYVFPPLFSIPLPPFPSLPSPNPAIGVLEERCEEFRWRKHFGDILRPDNVSLGCIFVPLVGGDKIVVIGINLC